MGVRNEKRPLPRKQSTQMATLKLMEIKVTLRNRKRTSIPESAQIETLKTTPMQLKLRKTSRICGNKCP